MEEKKRPLARILSLDGGGIRGIIPAVILKEIEHRTGKRIFELFDLIAGTSTGGILAAGLTVPKSKGSSEAKHSAEDMLNFYLNEGKVIFGDRASKIEMFWRALHTSERIESVLKKCIGEDVKLSDALQNILITSYEIESSMPMIFNSRRAKEQPAWDYRLWEVTRATSAAPMYFQPYKLERKKDEARLVAGNDDPLTGAYEEWDVDYYALVDGGVFANNPTMCAYTEANRYRGPKYEELINSQEYFVVSIGTGETRKGIKLDRVKGGGVKWADISGGVPIIDAMFQANSENVDSQVRKICSHKPDQYFRIQTVISPNRASLDDISKRNLDGLVQSAEEWINARSGYLDSICEQLVEFSNSPSTYTL